MNEPSISHQLEHLAEHDQLTLNGELTIYTVKEFKQLITTVIEEQLTTKVLQIRLNEINEIDSSGMQVFLFMAMNCQKKEIQCSIVACNNEVQELINLYNLDHLFFR